MRSYEKLDAFKAAQALALAVIKAARNHPKSDRALVSRLVYLSTRAAGKLAFGSGTRNRKLFRWATARSGGYLSEFGYKLSVVRVMGVFPDALCQELDALRGRASFYAWQLLESLLGPPPGKRGN